MSATNELKTTRIIGAVDDGKKIVTAFANIEAALRHILGIPADTAMSEAMEIINATGNVEMTGTLSANTPTSDLHAATRGYVTQNTNTTFGLQRAIVVMTSNTTPAAATTTYLEWDAEIVDDGAIWSIGNPTRFTIPADGEYLVGLNAYCNLETSGVLFKSHLNRSADRTLARHELSLPSYIGTSAATYYDGLSEGDFIEFSCYPRYTGTTTLYYAYTSAWIVRVA